jgi:Xaa-Pro aminopeptidase
MDFITVLKNAQEYLNIHGDDGWLLYDYQNMNPIFWETVGHISNVTRPCWLWIPKNDEPILLTSYVDKGRFSLLDIQVNSFINREEMIESLSTILSKQKRILMEYSPSNLLPRVSKVDAGTIELVKQFGVEIIPSGNIIQYATQRWTTQQLKSHTEAAERLTSIVQDTFSHIAENLSLSIKEYEISDYILSKADENKLVMPEGPVVAINEHSSDPHFHPTIGNSKTIRVGDWILIDLWARISGNDTMYADITWTGFVGDDIPEPYLKIFKIVVTARDKALSTIDKAFRHNEAIEGWEVDKVARDYISESGYGKFFKHRLGHSLGNEAHGNAVNLDNWETTDTRPLIPGIAITIEPGIYLPEFGVRSEIDVYISEDGPEVTTSPQTQVVLIN